MGLFQNRVDFCIFGVHFRVFGGSKSGRKVVDFCIFGPIFGNGPRENLGTLGFREFPVSFRPVFGFSDLRKSRNRKVPRFSRGSFQKVGQFSRKSGSSKTWNCDFLTRNFKFLKFTQNFIDFTRKPRYFRVQKLVKFLGYYYIF